MSVYLYNGTFYCEPCGIAIRNMLIQDATKRAIQALDVELKSDLADDKTLVQEIQGLVLDGIGERLLYGEGFPINYPGTKHQRFCTSCPKALVTSVAFQTKGT